MLRSWVLNKLEPVKDQERVLICDPLSLLSQQDSAIHQFACDNGFTVIVASTNLVFRELYEQALADSQTKKVLLIDRAPARRRAQVSSAKAPPPFYPDFLNQTALEARIDLSLREFLRQETGDPMWPAETNEPQYARLIAQNLDGVLRAHKNLHRARPGQFRDADFKTIVAYAALGIPDAAFKKLDQTSLWQVALLGHEPLRQLESVAADITKPILMELAKAPPPFCWFGKSEGDSVLRAFYLSLVISQHLDNWSILLANVDSDLGRFSGIDRQILKDSAPDLIRLDEKQAHQDLSEVEQSLTSKALHLLLVEQMNVTSPMGFTAVIEKEEYSTLFRSLATLMAVDDLLSAQPSWDNHKQIEKILLQEPGSPKSTLSFVDRRPSLKWTYIKEVYRLALEIQRLRDQLANLIKTLKVKKAEQLTYRFFWDQWNAKRINRLEYYLSAINRLINTGDILPRPEAELPSNFINAMGRIKERMVAISDDFRRDLDEVNRRFQEIIVSQYPSWLAAEGEVHLTSQFIRRCLKPHWDPQTEKAVIFIFDGMRYDIWDEMLRPMLLERMEVIADLMASALLPSETEISRWALSAGEAPADFWPRRAENDHLAESLQREFNYKRPVETVAPDGAGSGEVVRYRAENLDVYIFEFCDKELHKIRMRTLPDGRVVPSRPLAFIYEQHLKNMIDNEVMAIVRNLQPGTKVFVTSDHGFGQVPRDRVGIELGWLNEPTDCAYLNAWLRQSLRDAGASAKVKENVWEFPIEALKMPKFEEVRDQRNKQNWQKQYASVVFPKTGFALGRPGAHFNPDAFTHGGISIQELVIPMVVLRVRAPDQGVLIIDQIEGPAEIVEGDEAEFSVLLKRAPAGSLFPDDLRVDVEASIVSNRLTKSSGLEESEPLPATMSVDRPKQVFYLSPNGVVASFRFRMDASLVSDTERRTGLLDLSLTVTATYQEGRKTHRKSRIHPFRVQLSSERIVRRVGSLGNILGLTPRSLN